MPRLSEHERSGQVGMLQAGIRVSDVARHYTCHASTILRLRDRYQATGSVKDRRRSGQRLKNNNSTSRRPLTSIASKVSIPTAYRQCQSSNWTPGVSCLMFVINDLIPIALNHEPVSRQKFKPFHCRRLIHARTIRRIIQELGFRCHRPKDGCILTNRHKAVRLNWARTHLQWNRRQWGSV